MLVRLLAVRLLAYLRSKAHHPTPAPLTSNLAPQLLVLLTPHSPPFLPFSACGSLPSAPGTASGHHPPSCPSPPAASSLCAPAAAVPWQSPPACASAHPPDPQTSRGRAAPARFSIEFSVLYWLYWSAIDCIGVRLLQCSRAPPPPPQTPMPTQHLHKRHAQAHTWEHT